MARVWIAVDLESTGNSYSNPVNSIGMAVSIVSESGTEELRRFKWNLAVKEPTFDDSKNVTDYGDFQKLCWDEFWSKYSDALQRTLTNPAPVSQEDGWKAFNDTVHSLTVEFPVDKYQYTLLSDNPSFDIARIDFQRHTVGLAPLRFLDCGKYHSVETPDYAFKVLPKWVQNQINTKVAAVVTYDHSPDNDAHHILLMYKYTEEYRCSNCL
jgi:hypothetical protein